MPASASNPCASPHATLALLGTDLLAEEEQDELLSFYDWGSGLDPASSQPACCHLCQHLRLTCVPPIMRPSLHPSLPCFWPVWHRSSHACCIEWLASPSTLLCSLASTQSGRHRPVTCGLHRMVWSQTGISLPCFCAPFQASSLPALGPGTAARSHRLRQGLRHVARPTWWIWHGDRPPCRGGAATRRRPPCRGKARRAVVVLYD